MAFGASGANARVTPGDDPSVNRLTGKPIATQQATDTAPAKAQAPKGFSKEYLQSVIDGKHPRPMVSVEKAKELLKNVSEVFDGNKETGTTHKGGIVTKTAQGIKHTKTDYKDGHGEPGFKRKEGGPNSRYKHTPILDKDDDVEESSKIPFAGAKVGHKEGPAGQWRNDGAKKNKPARPGDLVGDGT